jgi:hypothetical protein
MMMIGDSDGAGYGDDDILDSEEARDEELLQMYDNA